MGSFLKQLSVLFRFLRDLLIYVYFACMFGVHHVLAWPLRRWEAGISRNWRLQRVVNHLLRAGTLTWVLCESKCS